jgi:hypothetical protein
MNSTRFFRQAASDQFIGSMAYLESQQSLFHRDQTSGMIEIQIDQVESVILLYARGNAAGTYHLTGEACKPILLSELRAIWTSSSASITSLILPDVAGRLVWLRLESGLQSRAHVRNIAEWQAWIDQRKAELQSGLVQLTSDTFDGFVYLQNGEVIKSESIFSTERGFQSNLPFSQCKQDLPCILTLLTSPPDSHASQAFLLRRGVADWTHLFLDRYREMVGQKLLQIMIDQSNNAINPWQWQVQLEGTSLWDQHFFSNLDAAVKAYRALLICMGEQSSLMIGNGLCQRLVSETYNRLNQVEKESLETHRLIPAAIA